MKRLINLVRFDCQLERFAEVFGDVIESEDIESLLKEACELFGKSEFKAVRTADSPDEAFDFIDITISHELAKKYPRETLGDRNYFLLRAFFRFVNDAYLWEDCEDLERWETELFDSLTGYQQKNYEPLTLEASEFGREILFLKFCDCLVFEVGETLLNIILESIADIRGENGGATNEI